MNKYGFSWVMMSLFFIFVSSCDDSDNQKNNNLNNQNLCVDNGTCGEHGVCDASLGVELCRCDTGWDGATCNACYPGYHDDGSGACVVDEQCLANTCSGHGACTLTGGVLSCTCVEGYTGTNCQDCAADFHLNAAGLCVADEVCADADPCGAHGTCVDTTGVIVCECAIGYTGTTCNACYPGYHDNGSGVCVLDEQCMPNTCSGNGVCTVTLGVVSCACAPGYSGSNCQDCAADFHLNAAGLCVADENCVDSDPCGAHGTCVDTTGIIVCECAIGHTGTTCESCYPGYEMCGDACVILWTDEEHCGACDNTCATGATCSAGACECNASTPCDGADFHGVTCGSLGFASGLLMCSPLCEIDTTGCIPRDYVSQNIGTLKYVPAGTFQRDATATNLSVVSVFRMSQYEITRAQWVAVTGWADPSNVTYSSGTNDPVQRVNWYDAIAFCNKLSIAEGRTQVYGVSGVDFSTLTYAAIPTSDNATWNAATANWSANGYRLPTEMEWMWAAMGADTENPGAVNTTGYANAFAGSTGTNAIGDYAVFGYNGSEVGRTTTMRSNPVGSKWANELGFHDLSGNVREWAWDWYGTYPSGTVTDYRGPASGANRVLRGGDWYYAASNCTVANQNNGGPSFQGINLGFRVVRP
jgi:formylglycine-generating enzyme required for sulfatase activity